jgi:diaminopimelate decarboxylase
MKLYHFDERVKAIERKISEYLSLADKAGTPRYLFDKTEVQANVRRFKQAFIDAGVTPSIFYAVKSNDYQGILNTVVQEGEGIDVSSDRELGFALKAGAKRIIYTGPAKTERDFEKILEHADKITVNLETFRELTLLGMMATEAKKKIKCGLRIITSNQKGWTKFGLPLTELRAFYDLSKEFPAIQFSGLHFHISFNKDSSGYVETMKEIAEYLMAHFSDEERAGFKYLDMGGGFIPESFDGVYPWNPDQMMWGQDQSEVLSKILSDKYTPRVIPTETESIEGFAKDIAKVFLSDICKAIPNAELYCEPGRFICHSAMHFLLRLIDIKTPQIGIVDGGLGMQGWEKFQFINYAPIFNLSQFSSTREIPFLIYGSLCLPDDIWGYYLYTADQPKEGDVLLVPHQGAYTYTLAQTFIKEIPDVYDL